MAGAFFLRCIDLQNQFEISRGVPPIFRLIDKLITILYRVPLFATPMALSLHSANHHKVENCPDDNSFEFDLIDIQEHLLAHTIKLSHNWDPQTLLLISLLWIIVP